MSAVAAADDLSTRPLHVGLFTDDFYPESGGVARSVQLQVQALVSAGHRVTLFAPDVNLIPPSDASCRPVSTWRFGTPSYLCSLRCHPRLADRISAEHPDLDIVHSQNERGAIFLAAQVAQRLRIPQVHTFHSHYAGTHRSSPLASGLNSLTYLNWSGRVLRRLSACGAPTPLSRSEPDSLAGSRLERADWRSLARLASAVDHFTSPAPFVVAGIVAASGGVLADRATPLPSGINEAFFRARRRRPFGGKIRFLSAGRLGPEKRIDVLLDAFALLDRNDAELHIIGTGGSEASLRRRAARIRSGSVRFLGHFTDTEQLAAQFADADIFVLASDGFDTQGLVLAEAAATTTPILYCDPELTVGTGPGNALLTGPSATELAHGMRALIDDAPRRAVMARAATALAPTLSSETMAARYLDIYTSAVAERHRFRPVAQAPWPRAPLPAEPADEPARPGGTC